MNSKKCNFISRGSAETVNEGPQFQISALEPGHSGVYECVARNEHGSLEHNFRLSTFCKKHTEHLN